MRRRLYSDLSPDELRAATPDPTRLVSLGEQVRFDDVLTASGRKTVTVVYEAFVEYKHGGFDNRVWHRYKDDPSVLIPQFDLHNPDTVEKCDPFSDEEMAAMRSSLPSPAPAIQDQPPQPLFEKPNW